MHFMCGTVKENGLAAQRLKDFRVGFCRMPKHLSVFVRSCVRYKSTVRHCKIPAVEKAVLYTLEGSPSTKYKAVGVALA